MDNDSILEKASAYADAVTSLTPNEASRLGEAFEEARIWFDELPRWFASDGVLIRKYACLSHYSRWTEQYAEVFRCVERIEDFAPDKDDALYCSLIYRNAARVANFLGMVNTSIDYCYKAISMAERAQRKDEICRCYNLIGGSFNILELYDVSFDFYKKAYRLAVETDSLTSRLISLNNMGYNRILVRDFGLAEGLLQKARDLIGTGQVRPDLHIQIHNNLAMVALHQERFADAHEHIAVAKRYNAIHKVSSDSISTLQVESALFLEEGRPQDAIAALESALALSTGKGMERYTLAIEKALSDIYVRESRMDDAVGHLQTCLSLQERFTKELAQSERQITQYAQEVRESRATLERRLLQSVNALSKMGELRDPYTAGHQRRVAELACAIGMEMGLSDEVIHFLSFGALIHDIGKFYIPSDILSKPGRLTDLEYKILQTHAEESYHIVKEIDFDSTIHTMIHQHHERLDGSGYPEGLSGERIITESRILAVADVVEAMAHHRPYRPALGIDAALEEITAYQGTKYDPAVVASCVRLFRERGFHFGK